MGVGDTGVDFLDALNRQNIARGLACELVGAVAGTNGNSQRIQLRALDKVSGFFGVRQQLLTGHDGVGAVAVFLIALHGLQGAQAAQFTFYGDA